MRWLLVVAAAACGSSQPAPVTPSPRAIADAGVDGTVSENGPACMPVGRYKATWDVDGAAITRGGKSALAECGQIAAAVPTANMDTLDLDVTNGHLILHWPNLMDVKQTGECRFEAASHGITIAVAFDNGKGTGKADYSFGSPNHPDEKCDVAGAHVVLERRRYH